MKKRIAAIVLALCMVCALLPMSAFAANSDFVILNGAEANKYLPFYSGKYMDKVSAILMEYNGPGGDVTIPEGVIMIDRNAFQGFTSLTGVTIPSSVSVIDVSAFEDCTGLTSVVIPDTITRLQPGAFAGCTGLTSVTIGSGVDNMESTFKGCTGLTSVVIPDSVTFLGMSVFSGCTGLTSVTLPNNNTAIRSNAFLRCTGLTNVIIPDSVTAIHTNAFYRCTGLTSIFIPSSVTEIATSAFEGCENLTIYGAAGSYAETYAKENGFPFVVQNASQTPSENVEEAPPVVGGFTDVKPGDFFAEPVVWAVENGITEGTSNITFSPNQNCTVAQILTFLWRASDSSEPEITNPFADVSSADYYYKAALWAAEKGIVSGGTFHGNAPCTRSMAVTYMWKAAGSPFAVETTNFTDAPSGTDYAPAVAWAVEQGITAGTSETTFSPDNICTRGQIVTFLYRGLAR